MNWELSRCTEHQKQSYKLLLKNTLDKNVYDHLLHNNSLKTKTIKHKKDKFF